MPLLRRGHPAASGPALRERDRAVPAGGHPRLAPRGWYRCSLRTQLPALLRRTLQVRRSGDSFSRLSNNLTFSSSSLSCLLLFYLFFSSPWLLTLSFSPHARFVDTYGAEKVVSRMRGYEFRVRRWLHPLPDAPRPRRPKKEVLQISSFFALIDNISVFIVDAPAQCLCC